MTFAARLRLLIALAGAGAAFASCATIRNNAGLAGTVRNADGLREATALVWTYYGRTDPPPRVRIVDPADLVCEDPTSNKPGFPVLLTSGLTCREGFTISPLECSVAWHGESWKETALRHELMHVVQARRGIVDSGHLRIEWSTDVPAAYGLLQARGF